MLRNGGRYAGLVLGAGAIAWLEMHGVVPTPLPPALQDQNQPQQYLIDEQQISQRTWSELIKREDVVFCLIWFFVTAGPTTVLPNDFNTASNQINVIGNGAGGGGGAAGSNGTACGGSTSCGGSGC
jgi:hypothetical protein